MVPVSAPADAVVVVALVLGGLVLARVLAGAGIRSAGRGAEALARHARRVGAALRPGLARRVAAAVLGMVAPAAAAWPSASAAPAPVVDAATTGAARPPGAPLPAASSESPDPTPSRHVHVVRRGESLWSIAREHLGPHASDAAVARAWPRWWAANRGVVGPDPALIVPGQRLLAPGRRSAGTPTQPHAAPAPHGTPVPSALSLDPDRR